MSNLLSWLSAAVWLNSPRRNETYHANCAEANSAQEIYIRLAQRMEERVARIADYNFAPRAVWWAETSGVGSNVS